MTTPTPLPRLITSDQESAARRRRYDRNRRYYDGTHPAAYGETRRPRVRRNYIALFVDTVAAHMGTPRISWGNDQLAQQLEDHYTATLALENGELLDFETELACSVDGDAAWKVTWDEREARVRIARPDAATLFVRGRPDDPTTIELVAQQYELKAADSPVMFPDRVVTFGPRARVRVTEAWSADTWEVWLDEELAWRDPNPYGFIPYIVFPNHRGPGAVWGQGDGERIDQLQDVINVATADLDAELRLAGNVLIFEGVDPQGDVAVQPGAVWNLPEGAKAYVLELLANQSTKQRLDHIDAVRTEMHALARVPRTALGQSNANLSGVALQIELGPLVRLVARKRLSRTAALRARAHAIAQLGHRFGALPDVGDRIAQVDWIEAIASDRSYELANAEAELRLGRSAQAVLASIGVDDPAAELELRRQEIATGLIQAAGSFGGPQNGTGTDPAGAPA